MPIEISTTERPTAPVQSNAFDEFLTMREAMAKLRYSRPSIYRLMRKEPGFPRPIKMTRAGRVMFKRLEIDAWLHSRPSL